MRTARPKLSVCVITRNEERFIGQCLASVAVLQPHELIVVDSGSTDRTVAIAEAHGARVLPITWRDDYAWARNQAIEQASGDWILFLDADEYWEGGALGPLLARTPPAVGGFLLERADVYLDPDSGRKISCPVGIVRLFRKNATFRYAYRVHEQINSSISGASSRIEVLRAGRLIHQVFALSQEFIQRKQANYLRLLEESLREAPQDEWLRYQQAKTLWFLKREPEALQLFRELSGPYTASLVIRCSACCNAAILLQAAGQAPAAIALLQHSLQLHPGQSLGYLILGDVYYGQGQYGRAAQCYLRTKSSLNTLRFEAIIPGDLYLYPAERLYKLGCCFLAAGRFTLARLLFRWGLHRQASSVNCLYGLAIVALARRDMAAARRYTRRCQAENPEWQRLRELSSRLGLEASPAAVTWG
ncbi:hypothetical protein GCM10023185_44690 [Hymenobacter saemangeumensis]|uniref:Glycosyltransferase 2-like domain-containing protein n=1 Tax=Hymenobacter saemangeumensis TaxID=1084522 RepID=A0ABP8ISA6_9BACT